MYVKDMRSAVDAKLVCTCGFILIVAEATDIGVVGVISSVIALPPLYDSGSTATGQFTLKLSCLGR